MKFIFKPWVLIIFYLLCGGAFFMWLGHNAGVSFLGLLFFGFAGVVISFVFLGIFASFFAIGQ